MIRLVFGLSFIARIRQGPLFSLCWNTFTCFSGKTLSLYFFIQSIRPLLGPGKTFITLSFSIQPLYMPATCGLGLRSLLSPAAEAILSNIPPELSNL